MNEAAIKIAEIKVDPSKDLPRNEILKALKYIPDTKNSKLIIMGLNCFQKFLNNQILQKVIEFSLSKIKQNEPFLLYS